MAKLSDITGKTFGHWQVLYRSGSTPNKASVWRCKCLLCGNEKDVVGSSLVNGYSTKCRRCVPRQSLSKPHRKDRIYHIYSAMKQRCYNPNAKHYDVYGGRGITVCDEWKNNPDAFIEWAYQNGYDDTLSLERIDTSKGYSPSNCTWIPLSKQAENRSMNHKISYNGNISSLAEACRQARISRDAVKSYQRKHGCSMQDAFNKYIRTAS